MGTLLNDAFLLKSNMLLTPIHQPSKESRGKNSQAEAF
jgi:hypothetical protein